MKKVSETINYVWVDEDGERISPVHETLGTSLGYVSTWFKKHDRMTAAIERAEHDGDGYTQRIADKSRDELAKIMPTGKPPHALKRWIVTTCMDDADQMETSAAELTMVQGRAVVDRDGRRHQ